MAPHFAAVSVLAAVVLATLLPCSTLEEVPADVYTPIVTGEEPIPPSPSSVAIERLRQLVAEHAAAHSPPDSGAAEDEQLASDEAAPEVPAPATRHRSYKRHLVVPQCLYRPPADEGQQGQCFLNPAVLGTDLFPDPANPVETMLLKTAFVAYQCHTIAQEGDCGKFEEPLYCHWFSDQERCAVKPDYLWRQLLTLLHCRDDTEVTPYWDRCYQVGLLRDDQECNAPNSDLYRCHYFFAREGRDEVDTCGPDVELGVTRDRYDEIVSTMRNGTWLRSWFGECETADIVYTVKSACNHTTDEACVADPNCSLDPDMPIEYGRCSISEHVLANIVFGGAESELFNATAAAMATCAAASASLKDCSAAGAGERVRIHLEKMGDMPDLVFIEELYAGGVARGALAGRWAVLRTLLAGLLATVLLAAMQE